MKKRKKSGPKPLPLKQRKTGKTISLRKSEIERFEKAAKADPECPANTISDFLARAGEDRARKVLEGSDESDAVTSDNSALSLQVDQLSRDMQAMREAMERLQKMISESLSFTGGGE